MVRQPDGTFEFESLLPDLEIYLANNSLSQLPGQLFQLQHLTVLSLRGNNLRELPSAISNLDQLRELNVANNNLRWLPFELRELFGKKLKSLRLHPNPFIRPVPKPKFLEIPTSPYASTSTAFFNIDGTLARGSSPTPTTTATFWPELRHRLPVNHNFWNHPQKTPSLFELSLRSCYKSPQLSQLPFLLPSDAPESLSSALQHTWHLKQQGGQQCTTCKASYIIPRTEWIEWWHSVAWTTYRPWRNPSKPVYAPLDRYEALVASAVPFLKRGCSWACAPWPVPYHAGCGWCPAKGVEEESPNVDP